MKKKRFLAAILLSLSFCFVVTEVGYGEIDETLIDRRVSRMEYLLLKASVIYVMSNPTTFLFIEFAYSPVEVRDGPEGVDIEGKIWTRVIDTRGTFSYKSGIALMEHFKKELEILYSYIDDIATDMDTDIVAIFVSKGDIPLGYFYQGEYRLWDE